VRSLNSQEIAVINPVKSLLGIAGGSNKKIKSKDLIGMKKKQKGGDTDPTSHTYSSNLANGYLVDRLDDCESAHYRDINTMPLRLSAYSGANTDSPDHATRLGRCLTTQIAEDTGRNSSLSTSLTDSSFDSLAYSPATCTSAQGVRDACIPGASVGFTRSSATPTEPVLKGYNITGVISEGGSRKRKSRSPPLTVKKRSSRKKARHSTRRSRIRSSMRKSPHKKTRRSSRK
jgi:hypothetical protein